MLTLFLPRQKIGLAQNEFGMKKQHIMKCEIKIFITKAKPIVLLTNALCVTLEQLSVNRPGGRVVERFLPAKPSTVEIDTRGQVGMVRLGAC